MASTPEGKVKKKLDAMLKEFAPELWFYSPQSGIYGRSGVPDRIACIYGWFYGIECKRDRVHEMTELQGQCRDKIMAAGGKHFVVYDDKGVEQLRTHIIAMKTRQRLRIDE
jgi:hypothetical protein